MSAEVALDQRVHISLSRLQREATEVEAAIALVAGRSQYQVLLCNLRYGGRLAASCARRAEAVGVRLEPVRRDRSITDIRVSRV